MIFFFLFHFFKTLFVGFGIEYSEVKIFRLNLIFLRKWTFPCCILTKHIEALLFFLWLSVNRLNYGVLLLFFEADVGHWTIFLYAMTKRVSQHWPDIQL